MQNYSRTDRKNDNSGKKKRQAFAPSVFYVKNTCSSEKNITFAPDF